MAAKYEEIHALVKRTTGFFVEKFGEPPVVAVCAPGRVNLIGDHVDYNGGFVLPMALPMVTVVLGRLNGSNTCRVVTDPNNNSTDQPKFVEFDVPSSSPLLPGTPKWANYVKGVVACFHGEVQGFDCALASSVPIGAGLSSSAAIEVGVYTLLEQLMESPSESLKEKALACQKAEHTFAHVPCGIMDQFISSMGEEGHAMLLDCKSMEGRPVPLLDDRISILIIDSGVKHELSGSEYPQRRSQCEFVSKTLNKEFLRDVSREELEERKSELDAEAYRRALHVINEIEYTEKFVTHLEKKQYVEAGQCMLLSHSSLRDLYNVSCLELDSLVEISSKETGVFGARMTGGGFGGCVVALVEKVHVDAAITNIKEQSKQKNIYPTFYISTPCAGARRLAMELN